MFKQLIARAGRLPPMPTALVHPVDPRSLQGALMAWRRRLIVPVLIGPEAKMVRAAAAAGVSLKGLRIVATEHSHAAAEAAVALARRGDVECIMKGSLHTDELMEAVLAPGSGGLRTGRRASHAFFLEVPAYPRSIIITDAAVNIAPDLEAKRDIVQNAIHLAHALGLASPRVAILSAVETVTSRLPSTLDAAALCKMADRGQITGGVLDGPLAFDNAISEAARRAKRITSPVAGRADILVVPDIESGNMLVKQLQYFGGARGAGVVLGTRVPVVLTSRSDTPASRLASCAIAALLRAHHAPARRKDEGGRRK